MPFYSSCVSNSDSIKTNYMRQNSCQLQILCSDNGSYQVSSSIHKNNFIPKERLFHKLSFHI